ncbi:PilZ domain-containing protein [Parageobacillus thermantarcticus]|uniref:PilZ domain-containing protein n=1 Tax=Parageobacillus thermantarcticus TaxID=186116 RepID=A0A1I0T6I8_9BACL|nr:PilZ domain-containing protein [Parageobacillus thermantarcticus]SFA47351.1 PilZ domain-containing protein [Parageobacillus thermantarcticus]
MRFRRQEAFRYQFGQPLPCTFRLVHDHEKYIEIEEKSAHIHDISPHGMKLETPTRIPYEHHQEIEVTFTLNDVTFRFLGKIVWERPFARTYYYGVRLLISNEQEEKLISEIKRHAALHRKR